MRLACTAALVTADALSEVCEHPAQYQRVETGVQGQFCRRVVSLHGHRRHAYSTIQGVRHAARRDPPPSSNPIRTPRVPGRCGWLSPIRRGRARTCSSRCWGSHRRDSGVAVAPTRPRPLCGTRRNYRASDQRTCRRGNPDMGEKAVRSIVVVAGAALSRRWVTRFRAQCCERYEAPGRATTCRYRAGIPALGAACLCASQRTVRPLILRGIRAARSPPRTGWLRRPRQSVTWERPAWSHALRRTVGR